MSKVIFPLAPCPRLAAQNSGDFDAMLASVVNIRQLPPVHCVIWRLKPIVCDLTFCVEMVNIIPLYPSGSLWLTLTEQRNPDGSLRLLPERLSLSLTSAGWFLADKVHWHVGKTPVGVLKGKKPKRHYLGSAGLLLRFTRNLPKEVWCDYVTDSDVWERSLTEEASWYEQIISSTCPPDGIVVDLCYNDRYISEAAARLGRQFIGIGA